MKVLYIHSVGPFGGSSRSLHDALISMPKGAVEPYFLTANGTSLNFFGRVAKDIIVVRGLSRFDNCRYSYYRGLRWIILLRELLHLPATVWSVLAAKRRWGSFDLIHSNEIVNLIPALLAKWVFRAPVVMHVRSLQRFETRSLRCRWINDLLKSQMSAVIAIDQNVRKTLPSSIAVDIIHNTFVSSPTKPISDDLARRLDVVDKSSFKVGFVGNLLLSKGLMELLEAARIVRESGRRVEFIVVGGATRPSGIAAYLLGRLGFLQDVHAQVLKAINEYGLKDVFHLVGVTPDIKYVYDSIDVLCFPSHLEAPGRPVFEAAFSSVPSIVALPDPQEDTLIDGETGIAVPHRDSARLAEAIMRLADDPTETKRMGANARALAERNFTPETNAKQLLDVYKRVMQDAFMSPDKPLRPTAEALGTRAGV